MKRKTRKVKKRPQLLDLKEISVILGRKRVLTWEEITGKVFKTMSYEECVAEAKEFVSIGKTNRLLVAAMCERVCDIRPGWSPNDDRYSMSQFARDIGVDPRTLWKWIDIKRTIISKLPPKLEKIEWRACDLARRYLYMHEDTKLSIPVLYEKHKLRSPARDANEILRQARFVHTRLQEKKLDGFEPEEVIMLRDFLAKSLKIVKAYDF